MIYDIMNISWLTTVNIFFKKWLKPRFIVQGYYVHVLFKQQHSVTSDDSCKIHTHTHTPPPPTTGLILYIKLFWDLQRTVLSFRDIERSSTNITYKNYCVAVYDIIPFLSFTTVIHVMLMCIYCLQFFFFKCVPFDTSVEKRHMQ